MFAFEDDLFLVLHLMIAGRLRWKPAFASPPGRIGHAAFDFPNGTLILTEAGTKKRATLFAVRSESALAAHDPGGLEVLGASPEAFAAALRRENHTLKRALTDPHLVAGIGTQYVFYILPRTGKPTRIEREYTAIPITAVERQENEARILTVA